ncbi:MAG: acyl-CoA dehydrogenase domain protein [candidate division NC10 bacterium]|nr:acyl-CoA dehydrogenase domain protein [candidate division NC10 bacterium]
MDFSFTPEQLMFREAVSRFAKKELEPYVKGMEATDRFPVEVFKKLGDLGYLGVHFPSEWGGADADFISFCIVIEEICYVSAAIGINVLLHSLMASTPIYLVGSDEQKQRYFLPAMRGERIGAAGLTEPNVGSSAGDIETTAQRVDGGWKVRGAKMFTSNGPYCDFLTLVVSTDREKRHKGISLFVVDSATPGVVLGPNIPRMGIAGGEAGSVTLEGPVFPEKSLLGEEGKGFYYLMEALNPTRVALAAGCVGLAQAAFDHALRYAKERKQFGQPIGKFQGVSFKLADMAVEIELARLMVYKAAWLADRKEKIVKEAAMAKLYASEMATRVAHRALQIHGGYGYAKEYPLERYYRDARLFEIFQGTSEILRVIIGGQLGL